MINNITIANTYLEMVVQTNQLITNTNNFDTKNYTKSNGTFTISTLGEGLRVAGNVIIGNNLTVYGNASFANITTNNIRVTGDTIYGNVSSANITTNNISATGNVIIGNNLTVYGNVSFANVTANNIRVTGNTITLNSNSIKANTVIFFDRGQDSNSLNINAGIKWNETSGVYQVRNTTDGTYYDILTANNVTASNGISVTQNLTSRIVNITNTNGFASATANTVAIPGTGNNVLNLTSSNNIAITNSGNTVNFAYQNPVVLFISNNQITGNTPVLGFNAPTAASRCLTLYNTANTIMSGQVANYGNTTGLYTIPQGANGYYHVSLGVQANMLAVNTIYFELVKNDTIPLTFDYGLELSNTTNANATIRNLVSGYTEGCGYFAYPDTISIHSVGSTHTSFNSLRSTFKIMKLA